MNWTELIEAVAGETSLSRAEVRTALNGMVKVAQRRLADKEDVSLRGLGTLTPRWSKGRTLRSVKNGRKMWVGGRLVPKFRASSTLRARLAKQSDQSWKSPEHQSAWRLAETLIGDLDLYYEKSVPQNLTLKMSDADVRAQCESSLGANWSQAVLTFEQKTPELVRSTQDYLALAARKHWCSS